MGLSKWELKKIELHELIPLNLEMVCFWVLDTKIESNKKLDLDTGNRDETLYYAPRSSIF